MSKNKWRPPENPSSNRGSQKDPQLEAERAAAEQAEWEAAKAAHEARMDALDAARAAREARAAETQQAKEALESGGGIHHRHAFSDRGLQPKDTGETHTTIHRGGTRTSWNTRGGKQSGKHTTKQ